MIFKKFFSACGVLFAVIAFFRVVNGADSFSLYELVSRVQNFDFDYSFLNTYLSPFKNMSNGGYFYYYRLESISVADDTLAILKNIGVFFKGMAEFITDLFITQALSLWNIIVEFKDLFVEIYDLFTYVLGFR